jgi:hypothetical protein
VQGSGVGFGADADEVGDACGVEPELVADCSERLPQHGEGLIAAREHAHTPEESPRGTAITVTNWLREYHASPRQGAPPLRGPG